MHSVPKKQMPDRFPSRVCKKGEAIYGNQVLRESQVLHLLWSARSFEAEESTGAEG